VEVGHQQVLLRSLTTEAVAATGLAAFAILWLNLRVALRLPGRAN
jgi:hypothetical protein